MALEAVAGVSVEVGAGDGLVVGHGDGAVFALDLFATGAAEDGEGVAAAVEEDDDLLAAVDGGLGFGDELAGEDVFAGGLAELGAHVDEFDGGQGAVHDAGEHLDALVASALGVGPGLERGRGGAEDDDGVVEFGAHDGDVAAVVARGLFLLVAGVVLLVDQDEAEIDHGREDSGARTDDDAGFTAADAVPLFGAFVGREGGVKQATWCRRRRTSGRP